jgi:hypothetical protein
MCAPRNGRALESLTIACCATKENSNCSKMDIFVIMMWRLMGVWPSKDKGDRIPQRRFGRWEVRWGASNKRGW